MPTDFVGLTTGLDRESRALLRHGETMKYPGKDAPIGEVLQYTLRARRYEPEMRLHDFYGYHGHRFEIRGGISALEVHKRLLSLPNNPLYHRITMRAPLPRGN